MLLQAKDQYQEILKFVQGKAWSTRPIFFTLLCIARLGKYVFLYVFVWLKRDGGRLKKERDMGSLSLFPSPQAPWQKGHRSSRYRPSSSTTLRWFASTSPRTSPSLSEISPLNLVSLVRGGEGRELGRRKCRDRKAGKEVRVPSEGKGQ